MNAPLTEARFAARSLRRAPLSSAIAILTLAVGIGVNAAIFGIVREVRLRGLPFAEPDRLVVIEPFPVANPDASWEYSYPDFLDTRAAVTAFDGLAAFPTTRPRHVLEVDGETTTAEVSWVSGDFFPVLGTDAALGRTINGDDDVENAARVAVLTDATWRTRFGGDRSIVGRSIRLNGADYTVIGIMPPRVEYPPEVEIWTALRPELDGIADNRTLGFLSVAGRLGPGVTRERAGAEVSAVAGRLAATYRPGYAIEASVRGLEETLYGPSEPVLLLLGMAAGLVYLLACANVASLLLARAAAGGRDQAIRAALGASRFRLVAQPALQAFLLALAGGAGGLWLAWATLRVLASRLPPGLYRTGDVSVDGAVLFFGLAATVAAAAMFGVVPATRARGVAGRLRTAGGVTGGAPARRLSRVLMGLQLALAMAVLVAGSLVVRSFVALQSVDPGFRTESALTMSIFMPPDAGQAGDVATFYERLIDRTDAIPGVSGSAGVLVRPLEGPDGYDYPFTIEGRTAEEQATYPFLNYEAVTPGYFATLGIPILEGRGFETTDDADAPGVVVVSRNMADRFFPEGAIGRRIKWGAPGGPAPWLTIVGVSGSARYRDLRETTLDVYVPFRQSTWALNHFLVRTDGPPSVVLPAVREAIRDIEPTARAVQIASLGELVSDSMRASRFRTLLLGSFAGIALLLAAAGVFGVIGYLTAWRTREVGVRMAVGATPGDIRRLILGESLRTAAAGIAIGAAVALAGSRVLEGLLFGVPPHDPVVYLSTCLALAGLTLIASWLPARRAMRVPPQSVLRAD